MSVSRFPLDFLIIGTMKSGTSTLSHVLGLQDNIIIPESELHYFDRNESKGDTWYAEQLLQGQEPSGYTVGEKTPDYALYDRYAEAINRLVPEVKLIWMFRDPAKRAFSHYLHNVRSGRESKSFSKALEAENKRIKSDPLYGYLYGSQYADHVERYLKLFPKENMHFILFEDYVKNQKEFTRRVLKFLDVEPLDGIPLEAHKHRTLIPKKGRILYLTRKYIGTDNRIWNRVYRYVHRKENMVEPPKLEETTRIQLNDRLTDQINKLSSLTGLNTDVWFR